MSVLQIGAERYHGVEVKVAQGSVSAETFSQQLATALSGWQKQKLQHVFLTISADKAHLIPLAVALGFQFHRLDDGDLVLLNLLTDTAYVPHAASHHVGAGAVIVDEQDRLLVVVETQGPAKGKYKIPGGYIDPGEHIVAGIVREVREETGIEAEFQYVGLVRHMHRALYGKSNLYFVCRLRAISAEITLDPTEIAECLWLPLDEFYASDKASPFHQEIVRITLNSDGLASSWFDRQKNTPDRAEFFFDPVSLID